MTCLGMILSWIIIWGLNTKIKVNNKVYVIQYNGLLSKKEVEQALNERRK